MIVLDTNIVLDLFVFSDARVDALRRGLEQGDVRWIATAAMRDELEHVLAYAHIHAKLAAFELDAAGILACFDRHARIVADPVKAAVTCKDADDQKFIDLAVAHKCILLSKDAAVLSMRRRLAPLDVVPAATWPASA